VVSCESKELWNLNICGGKTMKNRILLIFLAVVLVVSLVAFAACKAEEEAPLVEEEEEASTEVFEFNYACPVAPAGDYFEKWQAWADDIERVTDGRVKITLYWGGALGAATDQLDMLESGIADIVYHCEAWTPGMFPLSQLPALPFLCATPTGVFNYGRYLLQWDECTEFDDYKVLLNFAPPGCLLWFTDKKVTTLEDIKGLKIRTGGGVFARIPEALGASAVSIPTADMYMSLERKIAQGTTVDPAYVEIAKVYEVLKYAIETPLYDGIHSVLMSKKAWDSLPIDLQQIIDKYLEETWIDWLVYCIEWESSAIATAAENGVEFYSLSDAEMARWKELLEPIVDDWIEEMEAEGVPAREAVDIVRKLTKYEK